MSTLSLKTHIFLSHILIKISMKKYSLFLFFIASTFTVFSQNLSISGSISSICEATVTLMNDNGNIIASQITTGNGTYIFSNLEANQTYEVSVSRENNDDLLNGVSTFDVVLISKHITGAEELNDPFTLFAADLDNSQSVSVMDLVLLRRVILGIDNNFSIPSWQFFSTDAQIEDSNNPWSSPNLRTRIYENLNTSISNADFIGYKTADVSGNSITDCN